MACPPRQANAAGRPSGRWTLATKWWEPAQQVRRSYYRVTTRDHQVFELFHDDLRGVWVLDGVLD